MRLGNWSWGLGSRGVRFRCWSWGFRDRGGNWSWALHAPRRGGGRCLVGWSWGFWRHRRGYGCFGMSQFGLRDLLAVLVDADGDLNELAAVLVPHVDAVFAGVIGSDFVDDEAGELTAVERDLGVLAGGDFLLILEPGDLRSWFTKHGAGQAQRLERAESQVKSEFVQGTVQFNQILKANVISTTKYTVGVLFAEVLTLLLLRVTLTS